MHLSSPVAYSSTIVELIAAKICCKPELNADKFNESIFQ
jgi:hypothetical protein